MFSLCVEVAVFFFREGGGEQYRDHAAIAWRFDCVDCDDDDNKIRGPAMDTSGKATTRVDSNLGADPSSVEMGSLIIMAFLLVLEVGSGNEWVYVLENGSCVLSLCLGIFWCPGALLLC